MKRDIQTIVVVFVLNVFGILATDAAIDADWGRAQTSLLAFIALVMLDRLYP